MKQRHPPVVHSHETWNWWIFKGHPPFPAVCRRMTQSCRVAWGNLGGLSFDNCHRVERELKQPSKHISPRRQPAKKWLTNLGGRCVDTFDIASICPRKRRTDVMIRIRIMDALNLWAACSKAKKNSFQIFPIFSFQKPRPLQSDSRFARSAKHETMLLAFYGLRAVNHLPCACSHIQIPAWGTSSYASESLPDIPGNQNNWAVGGTKLLNLAKKILFPPLEDRKQ